MLSIRLFNLLKPQILKGMNLNLHKNKTALQELHDKGMSGK